MCIIRQSKVATLLNLHLSQFQDSSTLLLLDEEDNSNQFSAPSRVSLSLPSFIITYYTVSIFIKDHSPLLNLVNITIIYTIHTLLYFQPMSAWNILLRNVKFYQLTISTHFIENYQHVFNLYEGLNLVKALTYKTGLS